MVNEEKDQTIKNSVDDIGIVVNCIKLNVRKEPDKTSNIIQIIDDAIICEDEDCIVICRVRYTTGEYLKDPTREECEKIMTSVLMEANFDKSGPIRFDEIQVLDFENGHGLLRHHINVAND